MKKQLSNPTVARPAAHPTPLQLARQSRPDSYKGGVRRNVAPPPRKTPLHQGQPSLPQQYYGRRSSVSSRQSAGTSTVAAAATSRKYQPSRPKASFGSSVSSVDSFESYYDDHSNHRRQKKLEESFREGSYLHATPSAASTIQHQQQPYYGHSSRMAPESPPNTSGSQHSFRTSYSEGGGQQNYQYSTQLNDNSGDYESPHHRSTVDYNSNNSTDSFISLNDENPSTSQQHHQQYNSYNADIASYDGTASQQQRQQHSNDDGIDYPYNNISAHSGQSADTYQRFDGLYEKTEARSGQYAGGIFHDYKSVEEEIEAYYHATFEEDMKHEATHEALVNQKFHLPGNTWLQDWGCYFGNNHPVLSICFHHPDHPIGTIKRCVILLGSMAFGLFLTNFIYLMFMYFSDNGINAKISLANFTEVADGGYQLVADINEKMNSYTSYELFLLLVGGPLHGVFDNIIWYLEMAPCFQEGGCLETHSWFGSFLSIFAILIISTFAMLAVMLRGISQDVELRSISDSIGVISNSHEDMLRNLDYSNFDFLVWWYTELAMEYFFFNFFIGTLIFSGAFSCCGRLPFMGGRRKEMEEMEQQKVEDEKVLEEHLLYRKREILSGKQFT